MQFLSLNTNALSSELLPEDDVDRLFRKLQPHEPPATIVKQILSRIRQLPPEQIYRPPTEYEETNVSNQEK